ncbi:MAG: ABC transporter permease, partial [Mesorhizobium sp.]
MIARALGRPGLKFNAIFGIAVTGALILLAVFGPWIAPSDPLKL